MGDFEIARHVAEWIEIAAIVVIAATVLVASGSALFARFRFRHSRMLSVFKHTFAPGLLIGLDLLIAADIIKTVTLEPTLENTMTLGLVVLIRTFLSWSLILEVEGRWPWERKQRESGSE